MKKRVLSALLAASMMLTMAPIPSLAAGPEAKEITLGTAGVLGYANGYDYVYYGDYEGDPVKWRVLDTTSNDGTTPALFLWSDAILGNYTWGEEPDDVMNPPQGWNIWADSEFKTYLQGEFFQSIFSDAEQNAVLATTKTESQLTVGNSRVHGCNLNGETLFPISVLEATNTKYGFSSSTDPDPSRTPIEGDDQSYWLRSPFTFGSVMQMNGVASVHGKGITPEGGMIDVTTYVTPGLSAGVRPAFNLKAGDVLFTSPAQGGKTADGLTAVDDTAPEEHKVTLLDSSRAFQVTEGTATAKAGETVTLTYTGAQTGGQEYISAMLTDANGTVLYYGHIQQPQAAAGTVQITLPAGLEDGQYQLKVFNEQCNGDYQTDYASVFSDVTLTVRGDGAFVVDGISYQTLDEAAEAAGETHAIHVVGSFEATAEDAATLSTLKTDVIIDNGGSVDLTNVTTYGSLLTYTGNVVVNAGGSLSLPSEEWFGGEEAKMQIAKGSVTISAIDKLTTDGCIWTLSDDAEVIIPENKTMNLQFTAADQNLYGTKLVVPENAVVTVNGTLRGVSGQKGSTIEADGTIDCTNGLLSLAGKAVVNIAETGSLKVGDKGIASNSAGTTQYTGKNINLAAGGAISLTANSAWKDHANDSIQVAEGNSKPSYTDANGNTVYGSTNVENPVAVYNGGFYGFLNDALTAAGTDGGVITLMNDVTLNGSTGAIANNVTVVVPTGRKLTAGNDAATILTSAGAIQVAAGGAVNLPTAEGSADWIGGADARLHLTSGTITYDLGDKMLTLDGNAEVPETQTAYLHLNNEGINAQIAEGSTLTVNGTLKAVAGSALTVDGTLNVEGTLTVAESVKNFTVNGTLNLPRMNKEEMGSDEAGKGMKGDITINSGATVTYYGQPILGGENAYLTLENGSATLNLANANAEQPSVSLTLTEGTAEVIGSNNKLLAALVTSDEDDPETADRENLVPFHVTIAENTTMTIPEGVTLTLPKNGALAANGTVNVNGTLDVNGNTTLTGTMQVAATGKVVFPTDTTVNSATNVTFEVAEGGSVENWEAAKGDATITVKEDSSSDLPVIDDGGSSGSGSTTYAVSVETATNGTVSVSPRNASKGATVTITVTPNEGYVLGTLTATDANGDTISLSNEGDGKYTFTMPASRVTVSATFVAESEQELPFTDVASSEWYYEAVQYVYNNELMNGMSATTFEPNSTTTRGMIVTMLYRLENEPTAASAGFSDVAEGQWYTDAVNWAAANNIVNGYGDDQFGPTDTITREQMMAILYRYAQYKGYDVTASADLSAYTDATNISSYAVSAMQSAVSEGLINGITDTTLVPGGSATRAQVAAILMRFCENVAK